MRTLVFSVALAATLLFSAGAFAKASKKHYLRAAEFGTSPVINRYDKLGRQSLFLQKDTASGVVVAKLYAYDAAGNMIESIESCFVRENDSSDRYMLVTYRKYIRAYDRNNALKNSELHSGVNEETFPVFKKLLLAGIRSAH